MKQSHKTLLLWAFILVMSFALFQVFMASPTSRTVAFSEFINDVRQHLSLIHISEPTRPY